MSIDLYRQSGDLLMRLRDATMQAAIDGDRKLHDRLERLLHKAIKRHGRRNGQRTTHSV